MKFSSDDVKAKVKDLVKNELLSHRTEGEPWEDYVEDAVPRLEKLIAEKKLKSCINPHYQLHQHLLISFRL